MTSVDVTVGAALPALQISVSAAHVVGGAITSRDWQPQHHDHARAIAMKLPDIILNTPSQLGLFCRFATNWSGPAGRIGRSELKMRRPVCPGDQIEIGGLVERVRPDASGWQWVLIALQMVRGEETASTCRLWMAVPGDGGHAPWQAAADAWYPPEWPID